MTSLQSPPKRRTGSARSAADLRHDLATSRPLVPTATLAGAVAAGATLLVCLALAVVGWFLTDAGTHGDTPDTGYPDHAIAASIGDPGAGINATGTEPRGHVSDNIKGNGDLNHDQPPKPATACCASRCGSSRARSS